jgi:SAM-dependent methyltransferase
MARGERLTDHRGRTIDFGRQAEDYDRYRPGFPESFFARLDARGWTRPEQRALDLGTGTGSLALGLAARGLRVTGLDVSEPLLEVARSRAEASGLGVSFVQGSAEHTGLAAASFDLVSAGQCWWWFDAEAAIAEVQRVLAPGGRLLVCNFSYLPLPGGVAARTESLILEHNPGWPKAGWRGVHPEQVEALDVGGFRQVESFSYTVDVPFSHEAWRGRVRTCNGVGSALDADAVERFDAELAALLELEFPGDLTVPHRVFAVSGLRPEARANP